METNFEIAGEEFKLRKLVIEDIEDLINVARQWVKDRKTGEVLDEELEEIRGRMLGSLDGNGYKYWVLVNNYEKPIGMCAYRLPKEKMFSYKLSPQSKSAELVNVFLDNGYRGQGLGRKSLEFCFKMAKSDGYDEIIWNSGPRYKNSAWAFYTALVGEPVTVAKDYYGENGDAPIWRKTLIQ